MLYITIPSVEYYDESKNEFFNTKEQVLQLEHSLVSVSKWESKWCKPFLSKENKTEEETIDYIRCMNMSTSIDSKIFENISQANIDLVNEYITAPMTATTFAKTSNPPNREIITAEIIYYWMIAFNIPFECQKWHLNRLLTLINVCNIKNQPAKKLSRKELLARNRALNEARKRASGTTG